MREIAQTIEHRARNANAQTAHLFFAERFIQRLKKQKSCFFANARKNTIEISCNLKFDKLYLTLNVK